MAVRVAMAVDRDTSFNLLAGEVCLGCAVPAGKKVTYLATDPMAWLPKPKGSNQASNAACFNNPIA